MPAPHFHLYKGLVSRKRRQRVKIPTCYILHDKAFASRSDANKAAGKIKRAGGSAIVKQCERPEDCGIPLKIMYEGTVRETAPGE